MSSGIQNLDDDILLSMAAPEVEQGDYNDSLLDKIALDRMLASIDTKTGAPANVRAAVSAAQKPDDRLATLRKFYPDAVPVQAIDPQDGVAKYGFGNFVYTNPETGKLTLFDEDLRLFGVPVPGLRDFVDVGPEIAEVGGGIAGGTTAAIVAAPSTPLGMTGAFVAGEAVGSATARESYIAALNYFGETEDTRSGLEKLSDFGTTAVLNGIGGPLVSMIFRGLKFVAGEPIRYMSGALSKEAKIAKDKMESVGITNPSAGMVTANPTLNLMESALNALPTSTKIMHDNAAQAVSQMDAFAKELAEKYGGIRTTSEAAEELMAGARKARVRYDNKVSSMYNEVNDFMPDNLVSDAKNLAEVVEKYIATSKTATGAPAVNPALRQAEMVLKDAKDGVLNYNQLKEFRSSLMHNLRSAESQGALSAQNRKVKELVGYVTKDLDDLVGRSPNQRAAAKYRAANEFVRNNTGKSGGLTYLDNIIKRGETRATNALNYVLQGSKDGGEDLLKLRQMLKPEEYSVMSGYMLGRMGLPTPGLATASDLGQNLAREGSEYIAEQGFSPRTFITNWNRLSKEAKEALFKNTEHADLVPALDNLVFTIDRIGKSADQMANPSGTARVYGAMGVFGVGAADAGLGKYVGSEGFEYGLSSLIAPYMSAKLLTNRQFVNWLAEGVEKAAYDPNSFGQHVRRLYQIYEVNPDIREEIRAITAGLTQDTIEPIPFQNSKSTPQAADPVTNEQAFREVSNAEVAGKLLPDNINLEERITSFELPAVSADQDLAVSPTVVPDERDREIAMREAGGIQALT